MTVLRPDTAEEAAEIVREADGPLRIEGGGGLAGLGRPIQTATTLKLDRLKGVVEYSPTELYATFRSGTTLAEAEAALAENNQRLAFEPPDLSSLFGGQGPTTVGGLAATGLSGPARLSAGALRDYLLGVRFIDGRGEAMHGGGRVMKNVTGYDLCKLTAGAFGTLGAITEVTFKALPKAPETRTLVLHGLDAKSGQAALSAALKTAFEPLATAYLPAERQAALRFEGFPESLDYRLKSIVEYLPKTDCSVLEGDASTAFWRSVRDADALTASEGDAVWRISTAPTVGPLLAEGLKDAVGARYFLDWAGGLVWLAIPQSAEDAGAEAVRAAVAEKGGHATLMRAAEAVRATVDVFEPLATPVLELTRGLKRTFDPEAKLNPGRMYAGV